jgi:hypothetical protein
MRDYWWENENNGRQSTLDFLWRGTARAPLTSSMDSMDDSWTHGLRVDAETNNYPRTHDGSFVWSSPLNPFHETNHYYSVPPQPTGVTMVPGQEFEFDPGEWNSASLSCASLPFVFAPLLSSKWTARTGVLFRPRPSYCVDGVQLLIVQEGSMVRSS